MKIGDRVRVISSDYGIGRETVGKSGVVIDIIADGWPIDLGGIIQLPLNTQVKLESGEVILFNDGELEILK